MNAQEPADSHTSGEPSEPDTLSAAGIQAAADGGAVPAGHITTGAAGTQPGDGDPAGSLPDPIYDDGYEPI